MHFSVSKWNRDTAWEGLGAGSATFPLLEKGPIKQFEEGKVYLGFLFQGVQSIFMGKAFEQEVKNHVAPAVYRQSHE